MSKPRYTNAYASLRIAGNDLDPLWVTQILLLPPDRQHRRGEPRLTRTRSGKVVRGGDYEFGLWLMSSEQYVPGNRLESHIDWILRELEPRAASVRVILDSQVSADIFCYSVGMIAAAPTLNRVLRERSKSLGLAIQIDHYNAADDDDDDDDEKDVVDGG